MEPASFTSLHLLTENDYSFGTQVQEVVLRFSTGIKTFRTSLKVVKALVVEPSAETES